jgi:hypothetical protein
MLLIVSQAATERLQSAVNGHANRSEPVLLKVVEELLQATQHCWELVISHSMQDAGCLIRCARQVAESGLLQQLGNACDYMASALDTQQQDEQHEQQQRTEAAGAQSPTTKKSSTQTSNKTQTAKVPTDSHGQQPAELHEQGGKEQQQLLQDSWICTGAHSLAPSLLSLWESLVQHWPGSWLQSPLAAATLLPAARLAAALISTSNSSTAAAQPLQESSAAHAVQDTAIVSSCSTPSSTSQEGAGNQSSSSQSAAGVHSRTRSDTGPSQQLCMCALKVSCKLISALRAPLAAKPAGCIPGDLQSSPSSQEATAVLGISLPWCFDAGSLVWSKSVEQLLSSKELYMLLGHHVGVLAQQPDMLGPVAAAAVAEEQLLVAAAGSTVVTMSCQSGEVAGLPHTTRQVCSNVQELLRSAGKQQQLG